MPKHDRHGCASTFSDSEFAKVLKQVVNPKHKLFLNILFFTGERVGAVCSLRVEDVYNDGQPLTHITFLARTRKADSRGRRHTRQVPVSDSLREILKLYKPAACDGWLFPNWLDASKPFSPRNADRFLRLALEKSNLSDRGFSTHSFRRTLITRLAANGIGVPVIQRITGHADLKSLQRYIDVSDEQISNALALI